MEPAKLSPSRSQPWSTPKPVDDSLTVTESATDLNDLVTAFKDDFAKSTEKYEVLRDLDFFVLDNSIRESTVGQLRGHTAENKWAIYNEVKKMGFKDIVVASFSHMTRVDDVFVRELIEKGEERSLMWAFSEITEGTKQGVPDTEIIPVGLAKMQEFGLYNIILEMDHGDAVYDFEKFPMTDYLALLMKRIEQCREKLHPDVKIMVNFRDLTDVMPVHPERILETVKFLVTLPERIRISGMLFEDASGKSVPEAIGSCTRFIKKIMDDHHYDGHLLTHVHEQFGYKDASVLETLMCGADGVWTSVCIEGAAMGTASSTITLMNLIHLGNKKVLKKYNCTYLRRAAINVTKITTGLDPYIKQPIYGERALDFVYDLNPADFDLAEFFDDKPIVRISNMATAEMIEKRLVDLFGDNSQFTLDQAFKMKELMLTDLRDNRKEEYMSPAGLALLFDRAGGSLDETMRDIIVTMETNSPRSKELISEVRAIWDTWDAQEEEEFQDDEMLKYDSFYNGFMAPYFGCYRCSDTIKALQAIDMDDDNQVDWNEFLVYLKWALHQYPEINDTQELLDITFRKGLIPAMHDEIVKEKTRLASSAKAVSLAMKWKPRRK